MAGPWPALPNPLTITSAGIQPQSPADLQARLTDYVETVDPGYTNNLPGLLIEDISSTAVAGVALCDQAWVDLGNSIAPLTANPYLLNQLGQIYGPVPGQPTNTSVFVQISGPAGFVIPIGFTVGDGTYQYIIQNGGIIATNGQSAPLFAIASVPGSWSVPANSVTTIVTTLPTGISLTVTNPQTGTPGLITGETEQSFRGRVVQAGLATCQGAPNLTRTLLAEVSGVQPNLIGIRQNSGLWEMIVGGGDPYEVAYAIYQGLGAGIGALTPSIMAVTGFTAANPGVVTTSINHGYASGQVVTITGADPTTYDGTYTITVLTATTFSVGVNTTTFGAYVGGGVCSPNFRNVSVDILDYPDTFAIPIVIPPQQNLEIVLTWNTTATNVISSAAVAQLGSPALVAYVMGLSALGAGGASLPGVADVDPDLLNGIFVGLPFNLFTAEEVFQQAVSSLIPTSLLSRMVWSISINGVGVSVESGTGLIMSDPESFFFVNSTSISIVQG
jgi:hypothetical protein